MYAQVIPEPASLIGDLLSMDLGGPGGVPVVGAGAPDLLGGGLDILTGGGAGTAAAPAASGQVT